MSIALQVAKGNGQAIDEYDLHVGAELRIAGRKVTIRKVGLIASSPPAAAHVSALERSVHR